MKRLIANEEIKTEDIKSVPFYNPYWIVDVHDDGVGVSFDFFSEYGRDRARATIVHYLEDGKFAVLLDEETLQVIGFRVE